MDAIRTENEHCFLVSQLKAIYNKDKLGLKKVCADAISVQYTQMNLALNFVNAALLFSLSASDLFGK